ncbi:tetratricopeptide repeat protein [Curvivirga aplysinae]|uniref:tetratricopeptide repeat protein n=1 Tax=Curvivirga aplysinae TaxID=2529852 RepID=UPI0012BCE3AC|nr:tetratricopeptide repeat protein [Curvivirga aplysinae]MTI10418.1 sel1 repeat family protein [Curvivirga aplysinae]
MRKLLKYGIVTGIYASLYATSLSANEALPDFVYNGYIEKAEIGDRKAMFFLGLLNEQGVAPDASLENAVFWYEKSAEAGNLDGAIAAARIYQAEGNIERAYEMHRIAASLGSSEANFNLGFAHEYGNGLDKDLNLAKEYYRKAAEAGLIIAMRQLGIIYWQGEGEKPDIPSAKTWLEKAAQAGDKASISLLNRLKNADENFEKSE